MPLKRFKYRSREVWTALAITAAAIAAVLASLPNREEGSKSAQPLALVSPKK
jgi:hypothetical protein